MSFFEGGLGPGVHFWGPRRGPFLRGVSWGPFFGRGPRRGGSNISGLGTLLLGFLAVLGYFWAFCRKNAVFDVLGLKCSKMSVFFIENNFWNNISARDAFPCLLCFRCDYVSK